MSRTSGHTYEAIIVGAGPAGSVTAALLAARGVRVVLLDRARFPRPKPCAEYLSPEASRILDRLVPPGVFDAERPARLVGMRVVSPDGTACTGRFAAARPYRGYRDYGLALPRERLDHRLLEAAVARGAVFAERTTVTGVGPARGGLREVRARHGGREWTLRAPLVVGADGLQSRVARVLGLARRGRRRRIALVSHAHGVADITDVGEMHVTSFGYLGLAPVGRGLTNVSVVVDLARETPAASRAAWLRALVDRVPEIRERLAAARFVTPVRAVGPFARWTRRATADGVMLVGDAADFYDPFTGEGIFAAVRGGELAAAHGARALASGRGSAADLRPYDHARRRAFGGKWLLERVVSAAVARPALFDHVTRRLAARPWLAHLLVGAAGDFVPVRAWLRPAVAWSLIR